MTTVPTPTQLFDAPELAILAVLSTALDAAESSLLAANPDLFSPEDYLRDPVLPGPPAVVWTLLTLIRVLSDQLDFYRKLVDVRDPLAEDWATEF